LKVEINTLTLRCSRIDKIHDFRSVLNYFDKFFGFKYKFFIFVESLVHEQAYTEKKIFLKQVNAFF